MIRTFVAVDIPAAFHAKISAIQSKFIGPGLRPVDPSIVHITMKFLGDVDEAQLPGIITALDRMDCPSFDSRISGVGAFPGMKNPRVVWLGADGEYSCLHGQLESLLSETGFKKEPRKFIPHATLARITYLSNPRKKELISAIDSLRDLDVGLMRVNTVKLKKSTLTPQGPIYETLHEVDLP
ncbi:RNA 2',3'-cyclic phosphodiesterase [Methanomethylovorans sp. PtaU1.Bin093]|uniref:RNA 2',3'-cyclic phosphodiesterase n=1 Tax=Methanomethylovorans sp. PtaU1.Bin093 TaxID=1811679 RepID=UPI0025CFFBCC|nr:RNA 2',3'-cyclic phosphodiesterase [Methanomethylovorans sp. PtaU1.Bin093]